MSEDYFEVAWINGEKLILHGSRADGSTVERELTDDERTKVMTFGAQNDARMQRLLRKLAA